MSDEHVKGAIFMRCTEADRVAFRRAAARDGDRTLTSWLLRVGRTAARTMAATIVSISSAPLAVGRK